MNETVALTVGLLSALLIIAFVFWPAIRIFRRLQLNPAWLALLIIPLALLILLWFLAYARWPGNEQGGIIPSGPRSARSLLDGGAGAFDSGSCFGAVADDFRARCDEGTSTGG